MAQNYIGTSGFQYQSWRGNFYPPGLAQRRWLGFYAQHFNSVEINSTFYRLPAKEAMARWRDETPAQFCFAIKGSQYVTHRRRLRQPAEPIDRLFDRAGALGDKLGVVLWQLPEHFAADHDRLQQFCAALAAHRAAGRVRQAFELRHLSWFNDATYRLLRAHDYALVVNQSSVWPVIEQSTASWAYLRFHGPDELYSSGYSDRQLADWAGSARKLTSGDIHAYFNNDNGAFAPANARTLGTYLDSD